MDHNVSWEHKFLAWIKDGVDLLESKQTLEHLLYPVLCRRVSLKHTLQRSDIVITKHLSTLGFRASLLKLLPKHFVSLAR
jgi:hypothetical protein